MHGLLSQQLYVVNVGSRLGKLFSVCDTIRYYMIRDAILTCAQKLTWACWMYRTGPKTKKVERKKTTKTDMLKRIGRECGESVESVLSGSEIFRMRRRRRAFCKCRHVSRLSWPSSLSSDGRSTETDNDSIRSNAKTIPFESIRHDFLQPWSYWFWLSSNVKP